MTSTPPPDGPVYGKSLFKVGEPLPAMLALPDVAAILGIGMPYAWQLQRTNELKHFELLPRIGNRARYSGRKIQQWLDGDAGTTRPHLRAAR
jgi:hypothetical protein